jgi:type IV fimbrial biogenesis protein FimT
MKKYKTGFTLIELMIVLSIAAILLVIGVPAFQNTVLGTQRAVGLNIMTTMISTARNEAITRNENIELCASSDSATCSGLASWEDGWIIRSALSGEVLRVGEALGGSATFRSIVGAPVDRIRFLATGMTANKRTLRFCDSRGISDIAAINVSFAGQARIALDDDTDGTLNDVNGAEITTCT